MHSGSLNACFHNPWHEPRGRVLTPMRNLNFNYLLGDFFFSLIHKLLSLQSTDASSISAVVEI